MMRLSQAVTVTNGLLIGEDAEFSRVKIDSREIIEGDLFVAIPGENFDGHDYLLTAKENGAAGALVAVQQDVDIPQIIVNDTTSALGLLGSHWRSQFDIPVIAVTGSNGKTTVTALIASILNAQGRCLSPKGSFNNHWGVPLTLLELTKGDEYLVVEMGMNHAGEIDYLSNLAKPNLAMINNVAPAHLAGLGNVDGIAAAKSEIFNGLALDGSAVLNRDDHYYDYWKDLLVDRHIITFGRDNEADVMVRNVVASADGSQFDLTIAGQQISVSTPLLGFHNAMNCAAAAAACYGIGLTAEQIEIGLKCGKAVKGRLNRLNGLNGSVIIDDSYNANPASIKAAIDVLAQSEQFGVLVLGAMAELGEQSQKLHCEIGEYARRRGIKAFYCLSGNDDDATHYASGYGDGVEVFSNLDELTNALIAKLEPNVLVMVKGSRSSAMERVVMRLEDVKFNDGARLC